MPMYDFAALRFSADPNLADRVYWYLADLPLKEGEAVLAPVGVHERLQRGIVERTLRADGRNAPYDLGLIKRVAAKEGARGIRIGGARLLEFGGVRYDDRHYTRFGALCAARTGEVEEGDAAAYGYGAVLRSPDADDEAVYGAILTRGAVLLGGDAEEIFARLFALVAGRNCALPVMGERTLAALAARLG